MFRFFLFNRNRLRHRGRADQNLASITIESGIRASEGKIRS